MDVIVLDGRDVPNPEDMAMLQSLYSRSPNSVRVHLKKVEEVGSDRFIETYLIGYGHKSIGDCGTTTVFSEDVSMFVAKAVQDSPLYSGQEASTRYLDFGTRPTVNPAGSKEGERIQRVWLGLYKEVLGTLIPQFELRFPREDGQRKSVWKKAIKARAFDVARGFLPAGATTFVAWHTNLRQAHDNLQLMKHNPCAEIRNVACRIELELMKRYPSSFGHIVSEAATVYQGASAERFAFTERDSNPEFECDVALDLEGLREHQDLLESRPPKTELHPRFRQYGQFQFRFPLDFGSYRDLQRHRSCVQEMPLLTTRWGFMPWYLEQLDDVLIEDVCLVAEQQEEAISNLDVSDAERQYYIAMGYSCPIQITCSLPSAVYIAELRSGTTVHPTVRKVAQQIGESVRLAIPGIAMHHDMSEGIWDVRRGEQDIVERNPGDERPCLIRESRQRSTESI